MPVGRRRAVGWPAQEIARATSPAQQVSAEFVGITRLGGGTSLSDDATAHYPNPDLMLACVPCRPCSG